MADNQIALMARAPVFDTPYETQGKALDLRALMNKGQMADLDMQDRQQSIADAANQRAALQADPTGGEGFLRALASGGNVKSFFAAKKAALDAAKTNAETVHLGAQTGQANATAAKTVQETQFAAATQHAQAVVNVQTPQDVVGYIDDGIKSGVFPADKRELMLQKAQQYPSIDAWKKAQVDGAIPVLESMKVEAENSRNAATNQTSIANNTATNATSRANNQNTVGATIRGQNLTDARSRDAADTQVKLNGKAPAGYAWGPPGPDGNPTMIAVKGGPADLKMAGALNQDTQALSGSTNAFDRLSVAANEVLNHPGLKGITGFRGAIPNAPGTDAANAEALLGTLKSQVGFGVLQDMRNNSKTGGALGAVSDAEGKRLEANLAALDKSQSLEQFQTNLKKIITYSEGAKDRLREAYNLRHGEGSKNPAPAGVAPAATQPANTNAKGWTLHTDAKGNKAYVSPDGKSFEEVK